MSKHVLFPAGLARDLQTKLHGQHLAQSVVLKAIQGFINSPESNKPLTLSFHGWSGTGKNFVARIIADNLYRDGVKSECVRLFIAPFHFPHARLVDTYKVRSAEPSWHRGACSVPETCWQCSWDPCLPSQVSCLCVCVFSVWMIMITVRTSVSNQTHKSTWLFGTWRWSNQDTGAEVVHNLDTFLHNHCIRFQNNVDTVLLRNQIQIQTGYSTQTNL